MQDFEVLQQGTGLGVTKMYGFGLYLRITFGFWIHISPGVLLQYSFRSNLDHEVHAVDEIVKVERSI